MGRLFLDFAAIPFGGELRIVPTEGLARRLREHDFRYVRTGGRGGGFSPFRDGSTLSGVPLYRARGYVELERMGVPLANGESPPIVHREKRLSAG